MLAGVDLSEDKGEGESTHHGVRPLLGRWAGGRSIRSIVGGGSYQDLKLPPHVVLLRVRVRKKEPRKYSERGRRRTRMCATLVISQSVNFGSHHRTNRTYTHIHVCIVSRTYTEHTRSRRSPRVSGDDGGERCGPRREKTEKNSEGRKTGGKKNCTCNYPSHRHRGKVGFLWPARDFLSLPRRAIVSSLCGTN